MRDKNLERLLKEIKTEPVVAGLSQKEKEFFIQVDYLKERNYRLHAHYLNKYIEITKDKNKS